jgi:hypothetical protein
MIGDRSDPDDSAQGDPEPNEFKVLLLLVFRRAGGSSATKGLKVASEKDEE